MADFSTETLQARKWDDIFKILKKKLMSIKNSIFSEAVIQKQMWDKDIPKQSKTEGFH